MRISIDVMMEIDVETEVIINETVLKRSILGQLVGESYEIIIQNIQEQFSHCSFKILCCESKDIGRMSSIF